jgi:hypothetical protein
MQGEARLRGLYRIIYSKTIISVYTLLEAGASRDTAGLDGTMYLRIAITPDAQYWNWSPTSGVRFSVDASQNQR